MAHKSEFARRVVAIVETIPEGRVMTYGQIAALCGSPRAARIVGGVAHFGSVTVPWHRVVNKAGGLASGYHGGKRAQARHLEKEGVVIKDDKVVDMEYRLWRP